VSRAYSHQPRMRTCEGLTTARFKKGDRVAAFHVMCEPHGSYAEYAIAPAHTTFHIPHRTSFEEASTIPLAAMTSALALYQTLELPTPWKQATGPHPIIIYGGATAVGAFAIKLAKLSNISPIITVAGNGIDYVRSLGPDKVVDYRSGDVAEKLKEALGEHKCYMALDAVSANGTYEIIGKVLEKPGVIATVLPIEYPTIPDGIKIKQVKVSTVHSKLYKATEETDRNDDDFGHIMYRFFGRALADGRFTAHPQTLIDGLDGIGEGLKRLYEGKAHATKFVYRLVSVYFPKAFRN
jgi:NADPH2:quinone reductase